MDGQSNGTLTPADEFSDRGLGLSDDVNALLLDPGAIKKDIALVSRAVREKWNVPHEIRDDLVLRMAAIAAKESIEIPMVIKGEIEMVSVEGPADEHAIAAANVFVRMVGGNTPESSGINVNVLNNADGPIQIYLPSNDRG